MIQKSLLYRLDQREIRDYCDYQEEEERRWQRGETQYACKGTEWKKHSNSDRSEASSGKWSARPTAEWILRGANYEQH